MTAHEPLALPHTPTGKWRAGCTDGCCHEVPERFAPRLHSTEAEAFEAAVELVRLAENGPTVAGRPRPVGIEGTVEWAGDVYPAIRSRLDGETYAAFYEHRPDDWHFTTLPFVDLPEGECSVWCDRGELEDMCPECAGAAVPDRDEVVEP